MFRVADLFCGAGGFSEGFRQMGFDIVFALDIWKPAIDTHKLNHPNCVHSQMDILDLKTPDDIDKNIPDIEIIIGSPPCVAFSGSNKAGKADKTLGIQLMEAYLRIITWKKNKPGSILKYWIMENVPNSAKFIQRKYTFEELGLPGGNRQTLDMSSWNEFNAADFGAPQTRTRFFGGEYPDPEPTNSGSHWVTLGDVMCALKNPVENIKAKEIKDPCYGFSIPRSDLVDHFYDTTVELFEWKNALRQKRDHGFMGKMSFPEAIDRPSRTIMATRSASTREAMIFSGKKGKRGAYGSYRMPTIREIASIMSFPITYQFEGTSESIKYKLVGNAVCCKMGAALAKAILMKEGLSVPNSFIPLKNNRPTLDLTGRSYVERRPRPRKPDAKFSRHIPHLKVNGCRVDLSNRFSDFDKDNIRWSCIFHSGVGKNAKWYSIDQSKLQKIVEKRFIEGFLDFEKDINRMFGELPGPKEFQNIYSRLVETDRLGPEQALELMRDIVDHHFSEKEFQDLSIGDVRSTLQINRNQVPLRILAGIFICNYVAEKVNNNIECSW